MVASVPTWKPSLVADRAVDSEGDGGLLGAELVSRAGATAVVTLGVNVDASTEVGLAVHMH